MICTHTAPAAKTEDSGVAFDPNIISRGVVAREVNEPRIRDRVSVSIRNEMDGSVIDQVRDTYRVRDRDNMTYHSYPLSPAPSPSLSLSF
jgi:hypothetical protein